MRFFFDLIKFVSSPFFTMFPGRRLLCTLLLALSAVAIPAFPFPYVAGFVIVYLALRSQTINNRNHGPPPKVVPGKVFDRFISIWLENTNFADAVADREFCYAYHYVTFNPINSFSQQTSLFSSSKASYWKTTFQPHILPSLTMSLLLEEITLEWITTT